MEIIVCLNRMFLLCGLHEQNKANLRLSSVINNDSHLLTFHTEKVSINDCLNTILKETKALLLSSA